MKFQLRLASGRPGPNEWGAGGQGAPARAATTRGMKGTHAGKEDIPAPAADAAAVVCSAWVAFVLPDKNEFREGPHTACCAYARSNTVPFAAMLSMTGVTALCSP